MGVTVDIFIANGGRSMDGVLLLTQCFFFLCFWFVRGRDVDAQMGKRVFVGMGRWVCSSMRGRVVEG